MSPSSRILQPSLLVLLAVTAAVLYSYGTAMRVDAERFTGAVLALAAFFLTRPVLRASLAREEAPKDGMTGAGGPVRRPFPFRTCLLLVIALGAASFSAHRIRSCIFSPATGVALGAFIGTVEESRLLRYTVELSLIIHDLPGARRAMVLAPLDCPINRGDVVAVLSRPRPADLEAARDSSYTRGLVRRGFSCIAYADEDSLSIIATAPQGRREAVRSVIGRSIDRLFGPRTAALLKALYFGNKNHLDKKTIETYKKAGVMHVLAASGLHVGIVAAVPFMLLAPVRIGKRTILIITTVLLCFYLYITDMPVSLVRAFIMFSAYAAQRLLDMDRGAVNTLFLAASAILMFAPHELYEPGFQLTFGATLGILLFSRRFEESLAHLPRALRGPLAMTLSAQLPVFPIILFQMGEINLIGPLSNLVAVPGITFALGASIASHCFGLVSQAAGRLIALPVDCLTELTSALVGVAASLGGHFRPHGGCGMVIPFYVLYALPLLVPRWWRRFSAMAILAAFIGAWITLSPRHSRPAAPRIVYGHGEELAVVSDGNHALVHGRISGIQTAAEVHEALELDGVDTVQLELWGTDYQSLAGAAFLARRWIISSCAIDSSFRFSGALTRLVAILERDGVKPEFRRVPPPSGFYADFNRHKALFAPPVREGPLSSVKEALKRFHHRSAVS